MLDLFNEYGDKCWIVVKGYVVVLDVGREKGFERVWFD